MANVYEPKVVVAGQIHIHFTNGGAMSVHIGDDHSALDLVSLTDREYELITDILGLVNDHLKDLRRKHSPED